MNPRGEQRPPDRVYAPGARVLVRDEEWLVRSAQASSLGGTAVQVTGLSELVRGKKAIFLDAIDRIAELKPEETALVADDSPRFRKSRLYLETLLRRSPPTDERIYIGHRGAMNSANYQLVPAARALARSRPRILIADAVGLGKTLEVGVLLSELIRRGRGERILVVVLKSLLAQFQKELWSRFSIPLVRLDSVGIQRAQRDIPANMNPFYVFPRVIISIDTLKQNEKYRRFLEESQWDAIAIDECQNVAVRGRDRSQSLRARLASLLARTCDSLVLTSATPHDGSARSFASLMNLLEPTAIADVDDYSREDIEGLFVRRFKKDVAGAGDHFPERQLELRRIPPTQEEEAVFEALKGLTFQSLDKSGGAMLFRTTLLKAFLSSAPACLQTVDNRIRNLKAAEEKAKARPQARIRPEDRAADREALTAFRSALEPALTTSSKLASFLGLLEELGYKKKTAGARVVVFSERIETLKFLAAALESELGLRGREVKKRKSGEDQIKLGQVELFTGATPDIEQQLIADDFGAARGKIRVLLASDAASEGLNLHFQCCDMIHFDIPWSLITLEQRNGRIDRFGQEQTPRIRYLLSAPRDAELGPEDSRVLGDLRVLERLIEKEEEAQKNLGDAAELLKLYDAEREEEAVARAVQGEVSAEEAIPEPADSTDDSLSFLLEAGGPQESDKGSVTPAVPPSLFQDDLDWAREAFALIEKESKTGLEWVEDKKGFVLPVPAELKQRLRRMPRELRRREELKLTVDRELVMKSMAASRKDSGSWPEWQLFWDLHPVGEWLGDRVLGVFRRHEAPVLKVPELLEPEDAAFVFQGILSNKRSQPVLVDWFAVLFRGENFNEVMAFEDLARRSGLMATPPNPGRGIPEERLKGLRAAAVTQARTHMKERRTKRSQELGKNLRDELRRVQDWEKKVRAQVAADESTLEGRKGAIADRQRRRLEERRREASERVKRRRGWVNETATTVEDPYVRLAAVLISIKDEG